MGRRDEWRRVVDAEVERWSALPAAELAAALRDYQPYEAAFEGKTCQVEVDLLEDTAEYLHVMVSADDGTLPASMAPASRSFITRKAPAAE